MMAGPTPVPIPAAIPKIGWNVSPDRGYRAMQSVPIVASKGLATMSEGRSINSRFRPARAQAMQATGVRKAERSQMSNRYPVGSLARTGEKIDSSQMHELHT